MRGALRGARLGVARDYFGGDPKIDALAEAAIDTLRELSAEIVDPVTFDASFVTNVRRIADYRFKTDWEGYLATFGPEVPKTVRSFSSAMIRRWPSQHSPRRRRSWIY